MLNSKAKIFSYFLICFIIGVGLASFFYFSSFLLLVAVTIVTIFVLIVWRLNFWRFLIIGIILIIFGIWRYQISLPQDSPDKVWFYNGQNVELKAIVCEPPDQRINQLKLTVAVYSLDDKKVSGKVLVNTFFYAPYQYGDLLKIGCQLKQPENFEDFDYQRYLAKDNIYSICGNSRISLLASDYGDWFLSKIFLFKDQLQQLINRSLPEPQASLFSAIFLGSRRGVPADLQNNFSLTGTSHLIAISGLHITLIVAILMQLSLALYLPRRRAFWLITGFIIFYLTIIGFPASAVRASLMVWLYLLAMIIGRLNRSANSLLLAAAVMLLINPKILVADVGFQLSFCAVLGLIYFGPYFENWFSKLPSTFGIKESLQMTMAAQVTTLPLIIFNFGRVSLIAPLVNLIVLPILPFLMLSGFAAMLLSFVLPQFSQWLFLPAYFLLSSMINLINFFASLPIAAINF